jgi:excisionase family DNA binding protein
MKAAATPAPLIRGVLIDGTEHMALTVDQAAKVTGLSRDSLEGARDREELPFRYPGRKPLLLPEDLRAWLASLPTTPPRR